MEMLSANRLGSVWVVRVAINPWELAVANQHGLSTSRGTGKTVVFAEKCRFFTGITNGDQTLARHIFRSDAD
jgi:hypothetical protein